MRPEDNPIEANEQLFRHICVEDTLEDDCVNESAVDLQGTSILRHKYIRPARPEELAPLNAVQNGLAVTTPAQLPPLVPRGIEGSWEVFAWDAPEAFDDRHAEIRVGRVTAEGERLDHPVCGRVKSGLMKETLKTAIAGAMKVFRAPTAG